MSMVSGPWTNRSHGRADNLDALPFADVADPDGDALPFGEPDCAPDLRGMVTDPAQIEALRVAYERVNRGTR